MFHSKGFSTRTPPDQGRQVARDGSSKALESHKHLSRVPSGLVNLGTTCYLNVILQVLFMTDKCRKLVLSLRNDTSGKSPEEKLLKALADLFWNLNLKQTDVSTQEVTKALNIKNVYEQQDAAEYLQMILHKMPYLEEIFTGVMVTSTKCPYCNMNNENRTDFLSIPLSVDDKGQCDVEKVLTEYLEIHQMSGDDQLYCINCRALRDMQTKNDIIKWPEVLTLQLKRFDMAQFQTGFNYRKNDCNVNIPSAIQADYESPVVYELYAIINHHGTYSSGHYDAHIKDERGNWYHFNDHTVTKVHDAGIQYFRHSSWTAYLLMYRKEEANEEENAHANKDRGKISQNPNALKNTQQESTSTKIKQSTDIPGSSTDNQGKARQVSVSSSKMFKQRLKEEFQYLYKEKSYGERQLLNEIFIKPHITEEPNSHISDKREISNIFNIRSVLLKGDAGTGKTVTVHKFILDWAEEKSNTGIDYIFPIPFQKLNIIRETVKECSFMELLQRCFENTEDFKLHDSVKIMLIFDGLNEFNLPLDFQNAKTIQDPNKPASVSDLLTNVFMGFLLPKAQIWITSRPAAASQIPNQFIDRVTEIQGFDDQQKDEYFKKNISDKIKASKVIRLIQTSSRINNMCYLPDYCRIIAEIAEKMSSICHDDFPKTITQMYSKFILAQAEPNRVGKEIIIPLGRIAFRLLVDGCSVFCDEDLKKCDESDLIRFSIIKIEDKRKNKSFCFVNHRTQEFLAALYASCVINEDDNHHLKDMSSLKLDYGKQCFTDYYLFQKVMENTLEKQMDLFFCFLLGLTLESSQRALKDLLKQRKGYCSFSKEIIQHIKTMIMNFSSDNADKCRVLFDALKELDERYLIQEIKKQLKSGLGASPAQISALIFVLLNSEEKIKYHQSDNLPLIYQPVIKLSGELEVSQFGIADPRSNQSHLRELDLSGYVLNGSGVKQLSDLLKHPQCKLEKLWLRSCHISDKGCALLSSALRSNPSHLRELDLSKNVLEGSGVKELSDLLKHHQCKLEKLVLRSCHISERGCGFLSSALKSNPFHLRELDLSGNYFADSGVKQLSDLLVNYRFKLVKLELRSCCITESGYDSLSSALRSNKSLRELDMSGNKSGWPEVKQLSDLLANPQCNLEKLGLKKS